MKSIFQTWTQRIQYSHFSSKQSSSGTSGDSRFLKKWRAKSIYGTTVLLLCFLTDCISNIIWHYIFPDHRKITTMTPLNSENILIPPKNTTVLRWCETFLKRLMMMADSKLLWIQDTILRLGSFFWAQVIMSCRIDPWEDDYFHNYIHFRSK